MKATPPITHPASGLNLVLSWMQTQKHSAEACLKNTGLNAETLAQPGFTVTLRQEVAFYRNVLTLTGDPTIGLSIGKLLLTRNLGLLGFAMLSAPTLRQALVIAANFGDYLSFTWFHISFSTQGDTARFEFTDRFEIDEDVRQLLYDRDCVATRECIAEFIGKPFECSRVMLPHDGHRLKTNYVKHWNCTVAFGQMPGGIEFPSALLETPLPFRDPLVSDSLSQQCQMLLSKMTRRGSLVEEVRQILIGRPGYFPGIDVVAQRLKMPARTLRHRLSEEQIGYQGILDEVRFALAREYLLETPLPQHEIASVLGYTDPGNFTHAFKRWCGVSPREFRNNNALRHTQR